MPTTAIWFFAAGAGRYPHAINLPSGETFGSKAPLSVNRTGSPPSMLTRNKLEGLDDLKITTVQISDPEILLSCDRRRINKPAIRSPRKAVQSIVTGRG